jgi:C-terminal processing protease CtpA/Prc
MHLPLLIARSAQPSFCHVWEVDAMTRKLSWLPLLVCVAMFAGFYPAQAPAQEVQSSSSNSQSQTQSDSSTDSQADTSQSDATQQSSQSSTDADAQQQGTSDSQPGSTNRTDSRDHETSTQPESSTDKRQTDEQSVLRRDDTSNQDNAAQQDSRASNAQQGTKSQGRPPESGDNSRDDRRRDFRGSIQFGEAGKRGLTVNTVERGSIFFDSGLRNGDIIVSFNRRPIRSRDDFFRVAAFEPGQRVPVVILRNGRQQTIYITYRDDFVRSDQWIEGRSMRVYFGAEFDRQVRDMAVIVSVDQGSPAARAGLQRNDVIIAINGDRVRSADDALQMIESMKGGDRLDIEFTRHARTEAVLVGARNVAPTADVEARTFPERQTSLEVDTQPREARQPIIDRDSRDRNGTDRRENRGILPRFRNR